MQFCNHTTEINLLSSRMKTIPDMYIVTGRQKFDAKKVGEGFKSSTCEINMRHINLF